MVLRRVLAARQKSALRLGGALVWLTCVAAGCREPTRMKPVPESNPTVTTSAGANAPVPADGERGQLKVPPLAEESFPGPWCPDAAENAALVAAINIASAYWRAQMLDCQTVALTARFSARQGTRWLNYLVDYTYSMMGCPLDGDPLGGGISAFGPANISVLGINRPALGRDDVAHLITLYVAAFVRERSLSEEDEERLNAHLWTVAEAEIDPGTTAVLSRCSSNDAGLDLRRLDASAGDAGI